ncbi:MAG TPA: SHOCT domain-containing protein [Anaerolineales bacterium]|nr:SHOCT domain-containing protein [Anaerolineales bacterium]
MMHGFGFGGFGGFGWLGMILNLVITLGLIVGLVLLVVWAVRRLSAAGDRPAFTQRGEAPPTAREILQMRYARGEITRDQYQEMLGDLS